MRTLYVLTILTCCLFIPCASSISNNLDIEQKKTKLELTEMAGNESDRVGFSNYFCGLICEPVIMLNCGESTHPDDTGYPQINDSDECPMIGIPEYIDSLDLGDCGEGTIYRRWTMQDGNGVIHACEQEIHIQQRFDYIFSLPVDIDILENATISDQVIIYEGACDLFAVSSLDEFFAGTGDELYKIFRTYRIINWCEYDGQSAPVVIGRDEGCSGNPGQEPTFVIRRPNGVVYIDSNMDETDMVPAEGEGSCSNPNPDGYWRSSVADQELAINRILAIYPSDHSI